MGRATTLHDSDQNHYDFDIIYQNRQFSYRLNKFSDGKIIETGINFDHGSVWIYRFNIPIKQNLKHIRQALKSYSFSLKRKEKCKPCSLDGDKYICEECEDESDAEYYYRELIEADRIMKAILKDIFDVEDFEQFPYYSYCVHGDGTPQPKSDFRSEGGRKVVSMLPIVVPNVGFENGLIKNNDVGNWLYSIHQFGDIRLHYENDSISYIGIKHRTKDEIGLSGFVSITPNAINDKNYSKN